MMLNRAVLTLVTLATAVSLLMLSAGVAGQGNAASSAGSAGKAASGSGAKASSAEKTASSSSTSSSGAAAAAASPVDSTQLKVIKYGSAALSTESSVLTVKVTDEAGKPVTGSVTVKGVSLTRKGEKSPVLENVAFKAVTGDSSLFAYDFFQSKPLPTGYYTLLVSAQKSGASATLAEIKVNVLTSVDIVNAELSISDVDVGSKTTKLNYPSTHTETLEVDNSQRIQLRFQLKDRQSGEPLTVHQAFVRFAAATTRQEIVFIAEQDSTGASYKVDLALGVRSKDFNYLSGKYAVSLIVGDALVANSINWQLATVSITFNNGVAQATTSASAEYVAKPEITHIFREQEKRPHPLVSNFFTGLVMLPFFALFVMWAKIGINFSSFQLSLSAILFHTSLALIFLLYGCFFVKLNMFQTVKYLAGIGLLAYLSGHSLLSGLIKRGAAAKGKQQ